MVERILSTLKGEVKRRRKTSDKLKGTRVHDPYWAKAYLLHDNAKYRAKRDGLLFELDVEWFYTNLQKKCAITGLTFISAKNRKHNLSASTDRIDNSKGYTKENSRLVIWWYNHVKGNNSDTATWHLCDLIVRSLEGKLAPNANPKDWIRLGIT